MLPIHKIIWHEWREKRTPVRVPEPEAMTDPEQIRSYIKAYEWGGPASALQLYHIEYLSRLIRPGDRVLDLACGPGPLLLELARLYPDCHFIGADLSEPMLAALREQARARSLGNIETICEDIRELPSIPPASVDLVISTSALHHLPNLEALESTFERTKIIMKPGAGFYCFDFGLLRSREAREMMVAEVAKLAQPVTALDYELSLDAAFFVPDALSASRKVFGNSVCWSRCRFVDFFYFLTTPLRRTDAAAAAVAYIETIRSQLTMRGRMEYALLRLMQVHE